MYVRSIKRLTFVTEMWSVFLESGTEFLNAVLLTFDYLNSLGIAIAENTEQISKKNLFLGGGG
jgi:hypothetical protein